MRIQYKALIKDTILKELRSKTLITLFIVTTAALFLGHSAMSLINKEFGTSSNIAVMGVDMLSLTFRILNSIIFLVAVIFGISTIRSDFENNIIYQYLTFPISRSEYFFIRVIGTWMLVFGFYIYAFVLSTVLYSMSFNTIVFTSGHLASFLIMAVYSLLVIFMAILFSMLMNKLAAFISLFAVTIMSAMAYRQFTGLEVKEWFTGINVFKAIGFVLYMIFPRFDFLSDLSGSMLSGATAQWTTKQLSYESGHLIIISILIVTAANYIVKKKDF